MFPLSCTYNQVERMPNNNRHNLFCHQMFLAGRPNMNCRFQTRLVPRRAATPCLPSRLALLSVQEHIIITTATAKSSHVYRDYFNHRHHDQESGGKENTLTIINRCHYVYTGVIIIIIIIIRSQEGRKTP